MQKLLTEETPGKVMTFLGASLFSMALLFAVSLSDASFSFVYKPLPDPFAPEIVVNKIDAFAASYSVALKQFAAPASESFVIHWDQIKWVGEEASASLAHLFTSPSTQLNSEVLKPAVAGVLTTYEDTFSLSMDTLYKVLLGGY